jgi:hypothetical protein
VLFTIKQFLAPPADIRFVPQLIEAIVRQSSGSRVAIEWQSSGNRFLQAVLAGVCYVCNRFSAGDNLGFVVEKKLYRLSGPDSNNHSAKYENKRWRKAFLGRSLAKTLLRTRTCLIQTGASLSKV